MSQPLWAPRLRKPLVVALVVELLAIIYVSTMNNHDHIDAEVYQLGVQAWLHGHPLYGPLPPTQSGIQLPFIYPPFAALIFLPLGLVSKTLAVITVLIISHVALLVSLYLVVRSSKYLAPHGQNIALITLMLLPLATISEPVNETFGYTQINLILMAVVLLECLWRTDGDKKLPWPRGLLLGLFAGIKLTPAAFVLFFLLRRDFRAILWTVVGFLGTVVVGFLVSASDSVDFWTDKVFAMDSVSFGSRFAGNSSIFAGNQTISSMMAKWGMHGFALSAASGVATVVVLGLAVLGMVHALREHNITLSVMINAIAYLLISPISWTHHWVWAAPTLVLLIAISLVKQHWALLVSALFAAGMFLSGPVWTMPQGDGKELQWNFFQQLVGNAYVYFGIAFIVYCAYGWWHARRTREGTALTPMAGMPR